MVTLQANLPTEEELTVTEINLSIAALRAGANHLGLACEKQNDTFMLCRNETNDPRACINEGKEVTECALGFFRSVKAKCHDEFAKYAHCLDQSSSNQAFQFCRKTQNVFDTCISQQMGYDRPEIGYFCRVKVIDSDRPKPEETPIVYEDANPSPVTEKCLPRAKYGARYLY